MQRFIFFRLQLWYSLANMLHVWLIPALMILVAALCVFYLLIKARGGSGTRTEGRTVWDNPGEQDDNPPPA
ncbi:exported hypothetical protein [Verrucomicrobia bacterium]|nr:exported hypothetical protein [Verrucomicrobiota bacterium]